MNLYKANPNIVEIGNQRSIIYYSFQTHSFVVFFKVSQKHSDI